jgi:hypothetical protein
MEVSSPYALISPRDAQRGVRKLSTLALMSQPLPLDKLMIVR